MIAQESEELKAYIEDLEEDIRQLILKHNDLVVSVSMVWAEFHRTAPSALARRMCERRIDEMVQLLQRVSEDEENPVGLPANEAHSDRPIVY